MENGNYKEKVDQLIKEKRIDRLTEDFDHIIRDSIETKEEFKKYRTQRNKILNLLKLYNKN